MKPNIEKFEYDNFDEVEKYFIPEVLNGNIFHITSADCYKYIEKDNLIKNSNKSKLKTRVCNSKNSFGVKNNYICLYDLTDINLISNKKEYAGYKEIIGQLDNNSYILALKKYAFSKILKWDTAFEHQKAWDDKYSWNEKDCNCGKCQCCQDFTGIYIPYYECWYPEDINLNLIDRVINLNYKI